MMRPSTRRRLALAQAIIAEQRREIVGLKKELANARLATAAVARLAEAERAQVAPEPIAAVYVEGIGTPLYDAVRADTLGLKAVPA